jgi:hypothetical protein
VHLLEILVKNRIACVVFAFLFTGLFAVAQETAKKNSPFHVSTITGSGTAHYVAGFNGTTTIQDSVIYQTTGGDVGIATTTPASTLDVNGVIKRGYQLQLGRRHL